MNDDVSTYNMKVRELLAEAERLQREGDSARARELYRRLVSMALEKGGGQEEIIFALLRLGDIYAEGGNEDLALECYRDAEERSAEIGFSQGVLDCIQRRGTTHVIAGRWTDGAKVAAEGRELANNLGDKAFEAVFLGLLGQIERRLGNHDHALECAFEGLQISQMMGNLDEELTFLADMALISLGKQDFEGARRQADSGLRRAQETGKLDRCAVFLGQKCHALRGLGDIDAARECAQEGLESAQNSNDRKEIATFRHDLALLAQESGDIDGAKENSLEAYKLFLEMGNKEGALTSLRCLSLVFADMGDWEASFKGLIDGLVLAASMDRRLFMGTFLDVGSISHRLWINKSYDDMLNGLALMDEFFNSLEEQLEKDSQETYLTYLKLILDCLRNMAMTRGDKTSSHLQKACEIAAEVDSAIGAGMQPLMADFFEAD
mgnify:CR=1 FL=1